MCAAAGTLMVVGRRGVRRRGRLSRWRETHFSHGDKGAVSFCCDDFRFSRWQSCPIVRWEEVTAVRFMERRASDFSAGRGAESLCGEAQGCAAGLSGCAAGQ